MYSGKRGITVYIQDILPAIIHISWVTHQPVGPQQSIKRAFYRKILENWGGEKIQVICWHTTVVLTWYFKCFYRLQTCRRKTIKWIELLQKKKSNQKLLLRDFMKKRFHFRGWMDISHLVVGGIGRKLFFASQVYPDSCVMHVHMWLCWTILSFRQVNQQFWGNLPSWLCLNISQYQII